jgi:hypothetical protein
VVEQTLKQILESSCLLDTVIGHPVLLHTDKRLIEFKDFGGLLSAEQDYGNYFFIWAGLDKIDVPEGFSDNDNKAHILTIGEVLELDRLSLQFDGMGYLAPVGKLIGPHTHFTLTCRDFQFYTRIGDIWDGIPNLGLSEKYQELVLEAYKKYDNRFN